MSLIHVFEKAGLGEAPFKYLGCEYRVGPILISNDNGIRVESGAPGQPMGTCDYCGTGIAYCCKIQSADGKVFIVGTTCVEKTHDNGLINETKREATRMKRESKKKTEVARIGDAIGVYNANREVFEALPHSRGFKNFKTGDPLTTADEIDWMLLNAGHTGKLKTARQIERVMKNEVS